LTSSHAGPSLRHISELIRTNLTSLGYRKRRGNIYTFDLTEETIGWVGLNTVTHRGGGLMEINPVIGVRNQHLEKTLADIEGKKFDSYIPPTVCIHLGYLMPQNQYLPWYYEPGADDVATAQQMAASIEEYGKPFMLANSTLEALIETMANPRYVYEHQVTYRMPVALYLLGRTDEAREFLQSHLRELGDATHMYAEQYRAFADKFTGQL
jgi:hypothetical protein